MARPKRTAAAAAQTGAAQNRIAEVKKADEPAVKEAVKETVKKPAQLRRKK